MDMLREGLEKTQEILSDYKNKSNNDLAFALDYLNTDFEFTKKTILELTEHLDVIELHYNKIHDEYNARLNGK